MQSRAAIMEEIRKTIARSERLTEAAKTRARGNIEMALSGSGLGDVQKRSLTKTIPPANQGFRKGSIADQFQTVDPVIDQFHGAPKGPVDLDAYFQNTPADDAVAHFEVPAGMHGSYSGTAASEEDSPLARAIRDQYPTIVGMAHLTLPKPKTLEEHYATTPTTPTYEPRSGPEFLGPGPVDVSSKATARMTLHKGASMTLLQKLDHILEVFMTPGASMKGLRAELGLK